MSAEHANSHTQFMSSFGKAYPSPLPSPACAPPHHLPRKSLSTTKRLSESRSRVPAGSPPPPAAAAPAGARSATWR